MNEFGNYIKNIRESKNMTLNQVALYAEISAAQLSRIETGKRGTPKPQTIEKIARALKVDYNELMSIAGYIETDSSVDHLSEEVNSNPKLTEKDERDIGKRMAKIREDLIEGISDDDNTALSFMGEPMSEEAIESLLEALEHAERLATLANKKYIPKKYRKE
ncbi:helix-turn-helix transcriptional regulator [Lysinibacillus sp. 1 U-2021]|uniref:helix-turn-helix domain-containing protein n=1 Tax=Lysinibacillus sp. 1 U-2021 TaxID=3039426 RepID=UPI0024800985|nr:helix-turn-helix transcriptional regulator [Lysinibacillus sp. 1 U-2021]WGT40098.1 helix-turn-helix transcriptional regulator [Lysinibacillus sp. 1 U-2021]